MSVRRLEANRWQADVVCADGRRRRRNAATKKLAQQLEAQLRDAAADVFPGHPVGTLGEYIAGTWRPSLVDLSASTIDGYEAHVKHYITPLLGSMPLGDLTAQVAREFVLQVNRRGGVRYPGQPLSAQSVKRIYATLSVIVNMAADDGLCAPLPRLKAKGGIVRLPRPTRPTLHVPTGPEALSIISEMDDRYRGVGLLGVCGLRLGEALALSPRDLAGSEVRIHQTLEKRSARVKQETKTGRERTITIPAFVRAELLRALTEYPDDALIFHRDGAPLKHAWFWRTIWVPARHRAGLPDVRYHDLRHACASILAANGASPKEVQEYLGHSTPAFTLDRYTYLWPEASSATGERLGVLDGGA